MIIIPYSIPIRPCATGKPVPVQYRSQHPTNVPQKVSFFGYYRVRIMGNATSTSDRSISVQAFFRNKRNNDETVIRLMFPVYYVSSKPSANELNLAQASWEMIKKSTSPIYMQKKAENCLNSFPFNNCKEWFSDLFYKRLFDVHPVRQIFCIQILHI